MYFLLDIVYVIVLLAFLPGLYFKKKLHSGYRMRLGFIPNALKLKISGQKNIWVHAISVGEVMAVLDLVQKLRCEYPDRQIICSVVTKTGYELAQDRLRNDAIIIFAPLDFSWVVKKYVAMIRPDIYIFAETEIWPNLFCTLKNNFIPMIQVNGRISEKSLKGYQRIKTITRSTLSKVDRFCMQSQQDAERIESLGGLPDRIKVIGNLKFDNLPQDVNLSKDDLGFSETDELLIAGSTHPGEESLILDSFNELKKSDKNARLIICPRHVERSESVLSLVESKGFQGMAFSHMGGSKVLANTVVVVDTIGQLRNLYSLAKLVIIGKTFCVGGGQNMLEPAFFGKPVIVGPLTSNFKDIIKLLKEEKAIAQVDDVSELTGELLDIWSNAIRTESLGSAAKRVVQKYQGATARTMDEIKSLLNGGNR